MTLALLIYNDDKVNMEKQKDALINAGLAIDGFHILENDLGSNKRTFQPLFKDLSLNSHEELVKRLKSGDVVYISDFGADYKIDLRLLSLLTQTGATFKVINS